MSLRTDLGRVRGLGSAKQGTHHWWMQRVSALAMLPLTVWLLASLIGGAASSYGAMLVWASRPLVSLLLGLFVVTVFFHLRSGLQVVIEDYIHTAGGKTAALVVLTLGSFAGAAAGLLAVLKLAVGA